MGLSLLPSHTYYGAMCCPRGAVPHHHHSSLVFHPPKHFRPHASLVSLQNVDLDVRLFSAHIFTCSQITARLPCPDLTRPSPTFRIGLSVKGIAADGVLTRGAVARYGRVAMKDGRNLQERRKADKSGSVPRIPTRRRLSGCQTGRRRPLERRVAQTCFAFACGPKAAGRKRPPSAEAYVSPPSP